MSDQLGAVLLQYRATLTRKFRGQLKTFEISGRQGRSEMVQFVFSGNTGGPMCADNFRSRVFYKLIELGDVPRFPFHDRPASVSLPVRWRWNRVDKQRLISTLGSPASIMFLETD